MNFIHSACPYKNYILECSQKLQTLLSTYLFYVAAHGSNLGALFFNIPGIFPCLQSAPHGLHLPCFIATADEDGFTNGRALLQAVDLFDVFSPRTITFGLAFQNCSQPKAVYHHSFKHRLLVYYQDSTVLEISRGL